MLKYFNIYILIGVVLLFPFVYNSNSDEYENKREAQRWWVYHSIINFKQELSKFNISLELLVGDEVKVLSKIKKNDEL